jgi:hypothetical protein
MTMFTPPSRLGVPFPFAAARLTAAGRHDAGLRSIDPGPGASTPPGGLEAAAAQVALQTERRERAEQAAAIAAAEVERLAAELDHMGRHMRALMRDLEAAETLLREASDAMAGSARSLERPLRGRRILYVGGRPSSSPAIRDLVLRHGGEWQRHDGGLEDRTGLLPSAVAWADRVVVPVDCAGPDSTAHLKRLCLRQGVAFTPLRSASVASFAAALANPSAEGGDCSDSTSPPFCPRHG